MKTWKRVLSLMLAIVLVVTGIQFGEIISKADDGTETVYTEMQINSFHSANTGSGHWRINLNTSVAIPEISSSTDGNRLFFEGPSVETTLTNTGVQVYRTQEKILMLIVWGSGTTASEGDTVTLKAGNYKNKVDSSIGFTLTKDCTLVYNGSSWEIQVAYTEMPITGFNTPFYQTNESHWRVNFKTTATFPTSGTYYGATIEVNGEALSNAQIYNNGGYVLLVMRSWTDATLADSTTITLKEGYALHGTDKTVGVYIPKTYTIVYDADTDTWTATEYTDMSIINMHNSFISDGSWRINFNTTANTPSSESGLTQYSGLTATMEITNGGTEVYCSPGHTGVDGLMYIFWGTENTVVDGTVITVNAGYALKTSDPTKGIHLTEDYKIEYDAETNSWSPYVHTDYSDITATNLDSTSWYTEGGSQHWRLYAKVSGTFPTSDTATGFYSAPVYLNDVVSDEAGAKTSDAQVYKSGSNLGLLLWNYKVADPEVGTTITVKAGEYKDKGDATIGINITEDINFKWDGSEWYFIVTPEESAEFALDTTYNNGGNATSIYLASTDNRTVTGSSANITAVKSETYSGVLYNGEETSAYIRKITKSDGESCYWVLLGDAGIKAVKGDLVTLQGIFSYNNYAVDYEPITLLYDGTQWHTCNVVYQQKNQYDSLDFNTYDADGNAITDELDTTGWSGSYVFEQGGYYKADSGILQTTGIRKMQAGRYRDALTGSWSVGSTVVLDGIILDADKRLAIKFERATYEKYYTDEAQTSVAWKITENSYYDKSVYLAVDTEFSSVNEDTVTVVMQPSKGVLGEPGLATWQGLYVTAVNSSGTVTYLGQPTITKTDRGMLQFTLNKADLPSGDYTIVVKMGLLTPVDTKLNTTETIHPVYNIKDSYIYVNEYGIGYRGFVERANSSDSDEALTLDTSSTASSVKWTVATNGLTSNVKLVPADVDSGVFVNGVRNEDISIKKTADTTITVDLSGYSIKADDHVMVLGTFEYEEEFIEIAPVAASYNGSAWTASETTYDATITLNIMDDEYVVEGTDVTVKKNGTDTDERVLYTAGDYTVVRKIGDVTINYAISLYRPNDINQNNKYDVQDLVKAMKSTNEAYKAEMSSTGQLAASEGSITEARRYILGKTKADETLPTEMIGSTSNTGTTEITEYTKYISSVAGTTNGTTVIGLSDSNATYQPTANYDAYGFDYVLDFDVSADRELRVLQLSDTQIIDSAQKRYSGRLGAASTTAWATDQMDELLFDCMRATVKETQPDLILIAGDIIFGEFDDKGTSLQALVEVMESFKIPWAPVWGNHDNESYKGVAWQNAQFEDATYCLYYSGHDIGGNSNYSIGLAKNGVLQRSVYMMDSNFCANVKVFKDGVQTTETHINRDGDKTNGEIISQLGFTDAQTEWYRTTALRTNEIADKTIPSMLCYHVPTVEVWLGAKAACYQTGAKDKNTIQYTLGDDITIFQEGDSGFKRGNMISHSVYSYSMLDIMNEVGGDSASFGHEHNCSLSVTYGGVRWTFGLKTGNYDSSPSEQGGTLFTISSDGSAFRVKHIVTQTIE